MYRQVGVLLLALSFASAAYGQSAEVSRTVVGALSWSDMAGLTQDQIRTRLNLKPDRTFASNGYRLDGDKVISEILGDELVPENTCVDPTPSNFRQAHIIVEPFAVLKFEDGKFKSVGSLSNIAQDRPVDMSRLTVVCRIYEWPPPDAQAKVDEDRLRALMRATTPQMLDDAARIDAQTAELVDALAELRLGESPPGGAQAWAAAHPRLVVIVSKDGVETIRFRYGGSSTPNMTKAILLDGRVVSIEPYALDHCEARQDQSLLCFKRKFYGNKPPASQ